MINSIDIEAIIFILKDSRFIIYRAGFNIFFKLIINLFVNFTLIVT